MHPQELSQVTLSRLASVPLQVESQAPAPQARVPPWHEASPPQERLQGAFAGHWMLRIWQVDVSRQSTSQAALLGQTTFAIWQAESPPQSTLQRIPSGQVMVVP